MLVYLIPDCKTCIRQEKILKKNPSNVNIRYITMSDAKKSPYKFPLWINKGKKYQGLLRINSFGKVPTVGDVFNQPLKTPLCSILMRPGGPRDTNLLKHGIKNPVDFPTSKIKLAFGVKKSCFGKVETDESQPKKKIKNQKEKINKNKKSKITISGNADGSQIVSITKK
jgi:hypothetical protein